MKKTTLCLLAALLCGAAYAQGNDLVLLFESEPGMQPAGFFSPHNTELIVKARFDANGDGTPDIVLQRDDEQGALQSLRVLDGRTRDVLWAVQDVPAMLGCNADRLPAFWGFADPDGDDTREGIFGCSLSPERDGDFDNYAGVLLVNPGSNTVEWSLSEHLIPDDAGVLLLGVVDLTGDDAEDLVISLTDTGQIQVWGKP